jgi:hypothetical protein
MTVEEIKRADCVDGARFRVNGFGGIAFYFLTVEEVPDEDTEWSGYSVPTGNVLMVMVGDDRKHSIDPEDVETIEEDDYCHECGQIGCKATAL